MSYTVKTHFQGGKSGQLFRAAWSKVTAAGLCSALGASVIAAGQTVPFSTPDSASAPSASPAARAQEVRELRQIVARLLARMAIVDLRTSDEPAPIDLQLTAGLLRDASDLSPGDEHIARLAAAAAQDASARQTRINMLRRLVEIDPQDTTSQMALLDAAAGQAGDADRALALYAAAADERGSRLDPAIRSRAAQRAAMIRRERGDIEGFAKDLAQAVSLDSSNREAAALALEFFAQRVDDRFARCEMLANLLLADPGDDATHVALAQEFASAGSAKAALRFYENAAAIAERRGEKLRADHEASRQLLRAVVQDPRQVLKALSDSIDQPRREAQVARDVARAQGRDSSQLADPLNMRLPVELDRTRLVCALGLGDKGAAQRVIGELELSLAQQSVEAARELEYELAFVKAWLARDEQTVIPLQARLQAMNSPPVVQARLSAWKAVRSVDMQAAQQTLDQLTTQYPDDVLLRLVRVAWQVERAGKQADPDLDASLAKLAQAPQTAPGAWAAIILKQRGFEPTMPSPIAERFEAAAGGVPIWVDEYAKDPAKFITVSIVNPPPVVRPLEPMILAVRIRNNAAVPIALGPSQPIGSRLMIGSAVDALGALIPGTAGREVIDVDRRLRLMPREEITANVWADPGSGGWAVESVLSRPVRIRYRIIQDFAIRGGQIVPGPRGRVLEAGPISRAGVATDDVSKLVAELVVLSGQSFAERLLAARQILLRSTAVAGPEVSNQQRIMASIIERYRKAESFERMAILMLMPNSKQSPVTVGLDRELLLIEESDPLVVRTMLMARADDGADPLLTRPLASSDATTRLWAEAISNRLKAGKRTYATLRTIAADLADIDPLAADPQPAEQEAKPTPQQDVLPTPPEGAPRP